MIDLKLAFMQQRLIKKIYFILSIKEEFTLSIYINH